MDKVRIREGRDTTPEDAKIEAIKQIIEWKEAFSSKDGKKCLKLLKERFYEIEMIASNDPIVTQNLAAQRDVVQFVINKVNYKGEDDE